MAEYEHTNHFIEQRMQQSKPFGLLKLYIKEQKALSVETIRRLLEPLAGTSFMRMGLDALKVRFDQQRLEPLPHVIMPSDIYLPFFKHIDDTNIDNALKGTDALDPKMALWSYLTHNVAIASIYPDDRLAPGEMAFWQIRHDDVWHDEAHKRQAYIHAIGQWQFFKDGYRVQSIPMQRINWKDIGNAYHLVTVIPPGSPNGKQFFDGRMQGVTALPRSLQKFRR